jgi:3-oxoacyl-[acyl-carrier-protein] synthase I
MIDVFIENHCIISSLGITSRDNFLALKNKQSGIKLHNDLEINESPFWASIIPESSLQKTYDQPKSGAHLSRFEKIVISGINYALSDSAIDISDPKTLIILSTTKGSISMLDKEPFSNELINRINLNTSASIISDYFRNPNQPVIVCNACISGVIALIVAYFYLTTEKYENIIVTSADEVSRFVLTGFQSFQALSNGQCKPFDKTRNGINLGEAAATIILTNNLKKIRNKIPICLSKGFTSNDANHISGPSKTGEELSSAIMKSISFSGIMKDSLGFINAHGTATLFNDEMEAKAFSLCDISKTPLNSFKGNFGHTLGAAGIAEAIMCILSLANNTILPTYGFNFSGVSVDINVVSESISKDITSCLKTASGFGGCNAAIVFKKYINN